jgi:hypothetical protein
LPRSRRRGQRVVRLKTRGGHSLSSGSLRACHSAR